MQKHSFGDFLRFEDCTTLMAYDVKRNSSDFIVAGEQIVTDDLVFLTATDLSKTPNHQPPITSIKHSHGHIFIILPDMILPFRILQNHEWQNHGCLAPHPTGNMVVE